MTTMGNGGQGMHLNLIWMMSSFFGRFRNISQARILNMWLADLLLEANLSLPLSFEMLFIDLTSSDSNEGNTSKDCSMTKDTTLKSDAIEHCSHKQKFTIYLDSFDDESTESVALKKKRIVIDEKDEEDDGLLSSSPQPLITIHPSNMSFANKPSVATKPSAATKPSTAAKSSAATKSSAAIKSSIGVDKRKLGAKPSTTGVVVELADKEKRAKNKKIKAEVLQKSQFKAVLGVPYAFGTEHWKKLLSQMENVGNFTYQLFFGLFKVSLNWRSETLFKAWAKLEI